MAMGRILLCVVSVCLSSAVGNAGAGAAPCGLFFVTVTSQLSGSPGELRAPRFAEMTWDWTGCSAPPSDLPRRAAIYQGASPPQNFDPDTAEWWGAADGAAGWLRTNVSVSTSLPGGWGGSEPLAPLAGRHCWPFTAALYDEEDRILASSCFAINPTWMSEARQQFGGLHLHSMFLPGTHNSGCYSRSGEVDSTMLRYLLTQEASVWHQLAFGVRYLDFRVGFYPDNMGEQQEPDHPDHDQRLWVNHDMVRVQPLRPLLRDVRRFLRHAPDEVIVLDFHRFPVGFREDNRDFGQVWEDPHHELLAMITQELGEVIVPYNPAEPYPTMEDLWRKDGRVIVSYGEKKWTRKEPWLWPSVNQQWGNQQTLEGLMEFMHKTMDAWATHAGTLWAAMAELTPTMADVLFNLRRSSLRDMADKVNRNITLSAWSRWRRQAMIVASDFIEGTDLVNAAIAANLNRSTDAHIFPTEHAELRRYPLRRFS